MADFDAISKLSIDFSMKLFMEFFRKLYYECPTNILRSFTGFSPGAPGIKQMVTIAMHSY